MSARYQPGTVAEALAVANNLRPDDLREIEGLGHTPLVLPFCLLSSEPGVSFYNAANEIAGIAGVIPDGEGKGQIWMICTPAIEKNPHTFVRQAKKWLNGLSAEYQILWNITDARNKYHHKLLKLLGFKAIATQYPPPYHLPYYEIVKLCASPPLQVPPLAPLQHRPQSAPPV